MRIWVLLIASTMIGIFSCEQPLPDDAKLFTMLPPDKTGIDFQNTLMEDIYSENNVLSWEYYYNGGGVAIGDINNDGLQDVFLTGNTEPNQLYLNKGNLRFENISMSSGIVQSVPHFSTGATMVDINNDGYLDIYVCVAGPSPDPARRKNLLLVNNGDLTFREAAEEYGLDDSNLSVQAAFFDADQDGDKDCFVMNHSKYFRVDLGLVFRDLQHKDRLVAASSRFFRNDNGKYRDITEQAGMLHYGYGLGLVVSDINDDGLLDVYQANDYSVPDFMYINQGDCVFRDEQKERTKQLSWFAMGADIADINNDGLKDIGVVDMATSDHIRGKTLMASMDSRLFWYAVNDLGYQFQYMFNTLQLNTGDGYFSNVANIAHLAKSEWSWAALFADFDNDGLKDYFISNGYRRYSRDNDFRNALRAAREENGGTVPHSLRQQYYEMMPEVKLPNVMVQNEGDLQFHDVTAEWGVDQPGYSNGAAYGDLDNDGDLDLVVNNIDEHAFVYRNNAQALLDNHSLRVKLISPHDITGTTVEIWHGDDYQMLEHSIVRGFQSAMDPTLLFGLGDDETVNNLRVEWPDGRIQEINGIDADETIELSYDESIAPPERDQPDTPAFFTKLPAGAVANGRHIENDYDDFAREILLPYKQSTLGPFLSDGDVNGDGRTDFYLSGAAGVAGKLFLANENGTYSISGGPWSAHISSEDLGSLMFDADGDDDLDLYVVSGGNEFDPNAPELQDRLYFNNGSGIFSYRASALPVMRTSTLRVAAGDMDNDGDPDLFVGGRHVPGRYPAHEQSYLLKNDNGSFVDATDQLAPEVRDAGMVNDAIWCDINNDNLQDLVVAREWQSIAVYQNTGERLQEVTETSGLAGLKGWWLSLTQADVDNDGDSDFIAGNLGLNSKFTASKEHPFYIFASDFDQNGTWDLVLSKEYQGNLVPVRGRECSSQQMPFITEKFETYKAFATASLNEIYGTEQLNQSLNHEVTEFRSMVLINDGTGVFSASPLPRMTQIAPAYAIVAEDLDKDGNTDLVVAGNLYTMEIETQRIDAGNGFVLRGDGTGNFSLVRNTGFHVPGDTRDIELLIHPDGMQMVAVENNGPVSLFSIGEPNAL